MKDHALRETVWLVWAFGMAYAIYCIALQGGFR